FLGTGGAAVAVTIIALAVAVRVAALAAYARRRPPPFRDMPAPLPRISILLPLKDEGSVAASLVAAILALDYPPARIEVIALLEEDDPETRAALDRCLPAGWNVVVIPRGAIQTKARACTVGLALASGEVIVVFDGEDRPEPDQARKAVAAL